MATIIVDGVPREQTAEEEAALPQSVPSSSSPLDTADNTFQEEVPWQSLIES